MRNIVHLWRRHNLTSANKTFEEYLRPHIDTLFRLAALWCGDRDDAEDLLQATLCKLFIVRDQLPDIDQLRPWTIRVMYRLFVDGLRRDDKKPLPMSGSNLLSEDENERLPMWANESAQQPDEVAETDTLTFQLQAALQLLPPSRRALLIMHDVENYTLQEISESMEIPVGTVKSRLHRTRERLREFLVANGTFSPIGTCNVVRTKK